MPNQEELALLKINNGESQKYKSNEGGWLEKTPDSYHIEIPPAEAFSPTGDEREESRKI